MFIELHFVGMTRTMEVPEQIAGQVEIDWIPSTVFPLVELSDGKKSETASKLRLIFKTAGFRNEHGYLTYSLTNIDKIG